MVEDAKINRKEMVRELQSALADTPRSTLDESIRAWLKAARVAELGAGAAVLAFAQGGALPAPKALGAFRELLRILQARRNAAIHSVVKPARLEEYRSTLASSQQVLPDRLTLLREGGERFPTLSDWSYLAVDSSKYPDLLEAVRAVQGAAEVGQQNWPKVVFVPEETRLYKHPSATALAAQEGVQFAVGIEGIEALQEALAATPSEVLMDASAPAVDDGAAASWARLND